MNTNPNPDRKNIEDILALTPMQEGMLFYYLRDPGSDQYVEQLSIGIIGDIDVDIFRQAWNVVIETNEMLRTVFRWLEVKRPIQVILKMHQLKSRYVDFSPREDAEKQKLLENILDDDRLKGFDLQDVPFRITLCRVGKKKYVMIISNHHILYDGWSNGIILKEFFNVYGDLINKKIPVKPVKKKFREYIKWLSQQDKEEEEIFWREYFRDVDALADLSIKQKKNAGTQRIETYKIVFPPDLEESLPDFAAHHRVTPASIFYCAWGILLQRYDHSHDAIFGTTISGRNVKMTGIENVVGLFINTLPLRIKTREAQNRLKLLKDIHKDVQIRDEYSKTSLADIKAYCKLDSPAGLFDTIVVIENYSLDIMFHKNNGDLSIDSYSMREMTNYDLTLSISLLDSLAANLKYNAHLLARAGIIRLANHFTSILEEILVNPGKKVVEIDFLSAPEKREILFAFNDNKADYPQHKTIPRLFAEQVSRTPDSAAAVFENCQVTFRKLDENTHRLAGELGEKGVKPGTIVGIMSQRSVETIVGILGILKAGGAYLPIDLKYPPQRIRYVMADCSARMLLTQSSLAQEFNGDFEVLGINDQNNFPARDLSQENIAASTDLAYVIYTSGSSGLPKGVMLEHRNVNNLVCGLNKRIYCEYHKKLHICLVSPFVFDASVKQIFASLLPGHCLFVVPEDYRIDGSKLSGYYRKYSIEISDGTPTHIRLFLESLAGDRIKIPIKHFIIGGEVLTTQSTREFLHKFAANKPCISNVYGPTECCVDATAYKITEKDIDSGDNISIGRSMPNHHVYILDKASRLQPVGVPGEICISGDGTARGYINNPELTEEKFIKNPYYPALAAYLSVFDTHKRLYRTGDIGHWLPDGNIGFTGRNDRQVKVRGSRIELGEIENRLSGHAGIKEAVVVVKEDEGSDRYLCSYYVPGWELDVSELREYLAGTFPDYMIPSFFVPLEKLPLTINGKIDRKALPHPKTSFKLEKEYKAPGNEIEEKLVGIWQEVLRINRIGIEDNFFEIGGDSIKAIQISSRLHRHGLKLEIKDLFSYPQVKELSGYVKRIYHETDQGLVEGEVELTPIQAWFFESQLTGGHHFNQAVKLYREEGFNEEFIKKVFTKIATHHDALRMVYTIEDTKVIQENKGLAGKLFDFRVKRLENNDSIETEIENEANRQQRGIDLKSGPLMKLVLFKTGKGDYLSIVIHHLVVDGVSWRILLEDLAAGYARAARGEEIEFQKKSDSYKYWAGKLVQYARGEKILEELAYWRRLEETAVEALPVDFNVGKEENKRKNSVTMNISLDRELTGKLLTEVNRAYNTEINDILLTALVKAIKDWAGLDRVLINLEGHGREEIIKEVDINRTIGWFTSQFPVILEIDDPGDLSYEIRTIKETLRRIPKKGIGYGILRYLAPAEKIVDIKFKLEPGITFNYLGQFQQENVPGLFEVSLEGTGGTRSPESEKQCQLEINGMIVKDLLEVQFNYNRREYGKSSIEELTTLYKRHLTAIIEHCTQKKERQLTPSDFGEKEISLEDLDDIKEVLNLQP